MTAKAGNEDAMMEIFRMYQSLLIKNAMVRNVFDELRHGIMEG